MRRIILLTCLLAGCGGGGGYGGGSNGGGNGGGGGGGGGPTYTIGGTVNGLDGTLVLQNNGRDDLLVNHAGGTGAGPATFTFATAVANGGAYAVTVKTNPLNQTCSVSGGGSGTATANITNVAIACSDLPKVALHVDAGVHSVTLAWGAPTGILGVPLAVASFNVLVEAKCPAGAACPAPQVLLDVHSPLTVPDLINGQAYFFTVETVFDNGARSRSSLVGARPNALAFNGSVDAIAAAADGTVYLGGRFTEVGIANGAGVPLQGTTGGLSIPDFPAVAGTVSAAEPDGEGGWYLGGAFVEVAGQPRRNLAHVLASGALDERFHPNPDLAVTALARAGGTLYVGGGFTEFTPEPGGPAVARRFMAAIGADGTVDDTFHPDPDGPVRAIVLAGGTIYVGGVFHTLGNATRSNLAALDSAGVVDENFHPDPDVAVLALALADNLLYVGGPFTQFKPDPNGPAVPRRFVAAVTAAGVLDDSFRPEPNGTVRALAVLQNTVYLGGSFSEVKPDPLGAAVPRSFIAAVDSHGAVDASFHPALDGTVLALAVAGDTVYAGGSFLTVDGVSRRRLAAISIAGVLNPDFHPDPNNQIQEITLSGSTVFVGGMITALGSVVRAHLAATDAGGRLLEWDPSTNDAVLALAILGNRIVAGGEFTGIGRPTAQRNHLAIIAGESIGAVDPTFPTASGRVAVLAVSGNTVYVGGSFINIQIGGTTLVARANLAAIDAGGQLLPWDASADASVQALAISGNTVYVGGGFAQIGAGGRKMRNVLAAVDATSGTALDWNPNPNSPVSALAVSGGAVYAGGTFTQVGGVDCLRLVAIRQDATGTVLWTQSLDRDVTALVASGDTVYAGGLFTTVGAAARNHLAAFAGNAAQSPDPLPWDPRADGLVSELAIANGTVFVGGSFATLGGQPRPGFGALDPTGVGEVIR